MRTTNIRLTKIVIGFNNEVSPQKSSEGLNKQELTHLLRHFLYKLNSFIFDYFEIKPNKRIFWLQVSLGLNFICKKEI